MQKKKKITFIFYKKFHSTISEILYKILTYSKVLIKFYTHIIFFLFYCRRFFILYFFIHAPKKLFIRIVKRQHPFIGTIRITYRVIVHNLVMLFTA